MTTTAILNSIKVDAREVIFTTPDPMTNERFLQFKKNEDGDFVLRGKGNSLSNWQFKHAVHEIEWKADEQDWAEVVRMIHTGTHKVIAVVSR